MRHSSCRFAESGPYRHNSLVMRGLGPRIHVLLSRSVKDVDGRDKPGHDESCVRDGPGSAAHRFAKSYAIARRRRA
jgi:hypothetical protein